jgi:dTDP-4-amino-4,6-dideoxygalactose transaminase
LSQSPLEAPLAPFRFEIVSRLKGRGVDYYPQPVPHMSYYATKYAYGSASFPNAPWISNNSMALPIGPHVDEST